ncbi:MAG: PQQ-binding-like beta-propeller repeat protein [Planctomycetota bacterium]
MKTISLSLRFFALFVFASSSALVTHAQDGAGSRSSVSWNQFRGPAGLGVSPTPLKSIAFDSPLWRTPLKGVGWSSPATDGRYIWLTAAVTTEATAEQKKAKLTGVQFAQMKDVAGSVELFAHCLDAASGRVIVTKKLGLIDDPDPIHPMNSYASPTAAIAGDRVICHFGGYGTWCLDVASGEALWQQRLVVDHSVGPGSSPVIVDDIVVLICDGIDQQFVAGLSLETGEITWKTSRPPMRASNPEFKKAYSTPLVIEVAGRKQAVAVGAQWVCGYDPRSGKEIWRADHGDGFSTTPTPIMAGGMLVLSTGYMRAELVAVDPGGQGDVTETHIKWRTNKGIPAKPSPVTDGKSIYLISDDGIASAVSIADGSTIWRERIGGTFSASPLISGDQILIGNHEGTLHVFEGEKGYQEVGVHDFGEQIMATPVPLSDGLLIRTKAAIYRF